MLSNASQNNETCSIQLVLKYLVEIVSVWLRVSFSSVTFETFHQNKRNWIFDCYQTSHQRALKRLFNIKLIDSAWTKICKRQQFKLWFIYIAIVLKFRLFIYFCLKKFLLLCIATKKKRKQNEFAVFLCRKSEKAEKERIDNKSFVKRWSGITGHKKDLNVKGFWSLPEKYVSHRHKNLHHHHYQVKVASHVCSAVSLTCPVCLCCGINFSSSSSPF